MSIIIFIHLSEKTEVDVNDEDTGKPYVCLVHDGAHIFIHPDAIPTLEQAIAEVRKIEESRERVERARQLVKTPGVVDDDSAMLDVAVDRVMGEAGK